MLISSLIQLGLICFNGIETTILSWITSCFGSISSISEVSKVSPGDINMRIYSSCNEYDFEDFPIDGLLNVFQSDLYNSSNHNTVILALPYLSGIDDRENKEVIKALCQRCHFNIIVLDNSCNTNTRNIASYPATILQVYTDAKRFADVINRAMDLGLVKAENIYGLGYSLGAQIVGHVCRLLYEPCGLLYAFDPAGPFYLPDSSGVSSVLPSMKLVSRGDADLVVFVGCNEGIIGTPFHSGDINLHVNGGTFQPGCQVFSPGCNHQFCRKIMLSSILYPGSCQARVCETKAEFEKGQCNWKPYFTLTVPLEERLTYPLNEPIDVYMDTLQTDCCQGFYGSIR